MRGECFDVFYAAQGALMARGALGWPRAAAYAAERLGAPFDALRLGARAMSLTFARVKSAADDPRRFVLSPHRGAPEAARGALDVGEAAAIVPWPDVDDVVAADDLIAVSLVRERFWRLTCEASGWEHGATTFGVARLALRQSGRGYLAGLVRWLGAPPALAEHPSGCPRGALVLDPAAIDWTRRGWLKGVEVVEILDAPATGALGQALRRLNPQLGSPRGAMLVGTERGAATAAPKRRRAA